MSMIGVVLRGAGFLVVVVVTGLVAMAPGLALAQSGTWTTNGTGGTRSWSNTSNWSGGIVASGSGNTARFNSSALSSGTTLLDTSGTIGNITQSPSNVRVIDGSGVTLTLQTAAGSTPILSVTSASGALGIVPAIAGTQGFSKTGAGTLILGGTNTFTGTASLQTGTTTISNTSALGASGAGNETVVSSGAQLRISTSGTIAESFTVSGRGGPAEGAIRMVSPSTATISGDITLSGSAEFFATNGTSLTLAGNIGGTGSFMSRHGGSSGDITITGNLANNGWLQKVSGGGATSRLTLSGSNSYTSSTALDSGPTTLNNASALPATTALSLTGASTTLDLNGYDTTIRTFGWRADGVNAADQNNSNNGTITDTSSSSGTSTITVTSGSFVLGTAINNGVNGRKLALRVAGDNVSNLELRGALSTFSGGLTLLTGSGNGTRLSIRVPVVNVGSPGAITSSPFGTGTITLGLSSADKVQLMPDAGSYSGGVGSTILNDIIFNSAQGTDFASGVLVNATETTFAGTLVAGQASITIATGGAVPNSLAVMSGRITSTGSSGGLVLRDSGVVPGITVRLANATGTANDYQGTTSIEANTTLLLGAANQVPNGVGKGNVSVSGTFNLGGFSETINGLSGFGSVTGTSGTPTLTLGDGDATDSFGGVLRNTAGLLSLVKIGSGVQTLAGANTYSGSTSVSAGTLLVNGNQSAATGAVTVASGATLGGSGTTGGAVSILGGAIVAPGSGVGTLTVSNAFTLADSSILNFQLNPLDNTVGGGINDLITGVSNLTLDGVLNVSGAGDWTSVADFTTWRLFNYTPGTLTDNLLALGTTPALGSGRFFQIDTSTPGQVNLIAVPEPGAVSLLAVLALGGGLLVRRHSRAGKARTTGARR
jgi:fibronectin-binding autotransporter adhesin